jgi:hypothetical protein
LGGLSLRRQSAFCFLHNLKITGKILKEFWNFVRNNSSPLAYFVVEFTMKRDNDIFSG